MSTTLDMTIVVESSLNLRYLLAMKDSIDENTYNGQQISFYKKNNPPVNDLQFLQQNMFVIPFAFSKEHKSPL